VRSSRRLPKSVIRRSLAGWRSGGGRGVTRLPQRSWHPPHRRGRRRLWSGGWRRRLDRLLSAIPAACPRCGKLLAYSVRFPAFTGCREREALQVSWVAVAEARQSVLIGEHRGQTKSGRERWIEWGEDLASLISDLRAEMRGVSEWLFPSRRCAGLPAVTLRTGFNTARAAAGLQWMGFHHLRHYFASQAVMSGIDFKTVAE
jgi:integrase